MVAAAPVLVAGGARPALDVLIDQILSFGSWAEGDPKR